MRIDISDERFSPYTHLSGALDEWAIRNNCRHEDLIVDIWTSVLGNDRVYASCNSLCGYDFDTDWYEGGELELLAVSTLSELGELKHKL